MKKILCFGLVLGLLLTGCAKSVPEQAADGASWDESWTTLGGRLGSGGAGA